jgi:hypothetical protein
MRALLIAAGLALAAATVLAVANSDSAEFFPLQSDPATLVMDGTVLEGDGARLFNAFEVQRTAGYQPATLLLNSVGGQVTAGETLAIVVRDLGLATGVAGHDTCASICMLVFAAGRERWFMADASLGVHSILTYQSPELNGTGTEDEGALADTARLAREMKHLGTPDGIVTKLVTTPGTEMTWLTYEDLTDAGWAISAEDVQAARAAMKSRSCIARRTRRTARAP